MSASSLLPLARRLRRRRANHHARVHRRRLPVLVALVRVFLVALVADAEHDAQVGLQPLGAAAVVEPAPAARLGLDVEQLQIATLLRLGRLT